MIRQLPNGQWVSDKFFVTPDPATPGSFILRSKKTGKTAPWSPPAEARKKSVGEKLLARPDTGIPAPFKKPKETLTEDVASVLPYVGAAIATSGASEIPGAVGWLARSALAIPGGEAGVATGEGLKALVNDPQRAASLREFTDRLLGGGSAQGALETANLLPRALFGRFADQKLRRPVLEGVQRAMGGKLPPAIAGVTQGDLLKTAQKFGVEATVPEITDSGVGRVFQEMGDRPLFGAGRGLRAAEGRTAQLDSAFKKVTKSLVPNDEDRVIQGETVQDILSSGKRQIQRVRGAIYRSLRKQFPRVEVDATGLAKKVEGLRTSSLMRGVTDPDDLAQAESVFKLFDDVTGRGNVAFTPAAPGVSKINFWELNNKRSTLLDIEDDPFTPDKVKKVANILREEIEKRFSDPEKGVPKELAKSWRKANEMYAKTVAPVNEIRKIVKIDTPEKVIDKMVQKGEISKLRAFKQGILASGDPRARQAWNALRVKVIENALKDPKGSAVWKLKGSQAALFSHGQQFLTELFDDVQGRRAFHDAVMLTELAKRIPNLNPSGTAPLMESFRTLHGVISTLSAAAAGVDVHNHPENLKRDAMVVGGVALSPFVISRIVHSPGATRWYLSGFRLAEKGFLKQAQQHILRGAIVGLKAYEAAKNVSESSDAGVRYAPNP